MTLNKSKNSCIAWFKLAEFVDRKEKEKAIILYNLLSKSLNNNSFSLSLLGTIYKCFDDPDEAKKKLYLALELDEEISLENKIAIKEYLIKNTANHKAEFIEALVNDYKIYYNNETIVKNKLRALTKICDQETFIIIIKILNIDDEEK
jgi:tetratricopeptide (TPR) repeat protein